MIGKARRCNADRNTDTRLHLGCFVTTYVIWCSYQELITHSRTHKERCKVCKVKNNALCRTVCIGYPVAWHLVHHQNKTSVYTMQTSAYLTTIYQLQTLRGSWKRLIYGAIQEKKVNILGGDSIGHGEIKAYMNIRISNSEWLPRQRCLNLQIIKKHSLR